MMLAALGGDRDRAGDAIYGAKTANLMAVKERQPEILSCHFYNVL